MDIKNMFPMVTGFMNYGKQTIRAARYIGQSHTNRLPVTMKYPYEKSITSECFEFEKCIAKNEHRFAKRTCEVCVRVCPIDRRFAVRLTNPRRTPYC